MEHTVGAPSWRQHEPSTPHPERPTPTAPSGGERRIGRTRGEIGPAGGQGTTRVTAHSAASTLVGQSLERFRGISGLGEVVALR